MVAKIGQKILQRVNFCLKAGHMGFAVAFGVQRGLSGSIRIGEGFFGRFQG